MKRFTSCKVCGINIFLLTWEIFWVYNFCLQTPTVRVLKVAASITGQVWIFVKKTIQFVKIFPLRFQIEERFVSLVLTLLSNPKLNQDDWERVLQFLPENSPIEPGILGFQWFFSMHLQFSLSRVLCLIPIQ